MMKMKIFNRIAIIVFLASLFVGCKNDVNNWVVDPEYAGLFKSLVFELSKSDATSVEIKYTQSISATKYIFEFSKDSLLFNNIDRTVEVLADTLKPFAESGTLPHTEYRTLFADFDGNTSYSVRMKSVNTENGLESKYSMFYFKTAEEQIIESWITYTDMVTLNWKQTNRITKISVTKPENGEVVVDRVFTATEIAKASATFEGLNSGTSFAFTIYNNSAVRGTKTIKTLGLAGGKVIKVAPTDSIPALMAAALAQGNVNLMLEFKGGETYEVGNLVIPSGVANFSITGSVDNLGKLPVLNKLNLSVADLTIGTISFENVDLIGNPENIDALFMMYIGTDNMSMKEILFKGCKISFYRGVTRLGNKAITLGKIAYDDCLINKIGGYGVVNIGGSSAVVDSLSFTNCTLTDLATQLMDVRTELKEILIGNCTFCNLTSAMSQVFRLEKPRPLSVIIENNIFAGTNSGGKINAINYDMNTNSPPVSFGGSYMTSDLVINKYPFADINIFAGTTYDLFTDPDNKDFTIRSSSGFAGRGTAGDPRWFK